MTEENKLKGTTEDLVEEGFILRHPKDQFTLDGVFNQKRSVFTKCCRVKLTQADRFPVILFRHQDKNEDVIGHVWICRGCHRRTPYDSDGHTSAFRDNWSKRLPVDILKGMDRDASSRMNGRVMNGLSFNESAGPGVAYWLIQSQSGYEPLKYTKDPQPFELEESANAYQPGIDDEV